MCHLLKDYLLDWKPVVEVEAVRSCERTVTYGVPPMMVLRPLLFTIYISTLMTSQSQVKIIIFADIMAVIYQVETWTNLKANAEKDLK